MPLPEHPLILEAVPLAMPVDLQLLLEDRLVKFVDLELTPPRLVLQSAQSVLQVNLILTQLQPPHCTIILQTVLLVQLELS